MNERILIAEDERWTRQLLTKVLEREGLAVVACGDGAEALEWIRSNRFDAVVLDVMLPHVSGCDILAEYPSLAEPRPVFFVMTPSTSSSRRRSPPASWRRCSGSLST